MTTAIMRVAAKRSARRRDWRRAGMWVLQAVTAATFAGAAGAKVWATSPAPTLFDSIDQALGIGAELRYAMAVFEMVGGVALLDIDTAGIAAAVLSVAGLGAIAVQRLIFHTIPALPAAMLAATLLIAWMRRDELLALVRRPRRPHRR